jgi:hypothetical protein
MAAALGVALAGGAAAGVSDAQATVEPTVQALIAGGSTLDAGNIEVSALFDYRDPHTPDGQPVEAQAESASGAILQGDGAVSKATSSPTVLVSAGAARGNQGQPPPATILQATGSVTLAALANNDAEVSSAGLGLGVIGVGVTLGTATINGTTQALLQNATVTAGQDTTITAASSDFVAGTTEAIEGELLSGLGTVATGNIGDMVTASVGGNSSIQAGGNVQITANETTGGDVEGHGITAGGLAVGVSQATLDISPVVTTSAAGVINAGHDVLIGAGQDYNLASPVNSQFITLSQSAFAGVNASSYAGVAIQVNQASVDRSGSVTATLADGATVTAGGNLSVLAGNQNAVVVQAQGDADGVIGGGAVIGRASETDTVSASVGNNVNASAGGNLTVSTANLSQGNTNTTAGSLGLLAGSGSDAGTSITNTVTTTVGAASNLKAAGDVTVTTLASDNNSTSADGTSDGAVAVGISRAETDVTSNVAAALGASDTVQAGGNFTLESQHSSQYRQLRSDFIALGYGGNPPGWPSYINLGSDQTAAAGYPEGSYFPLYSARTTAQGSVGSALVGVTSAATTSNSTITNDAAIAGGSKVRAAGNVSVLANSDAFGSTSVNNSLDGGFFGAGLTSSTTNLDHTNSVNLAPNVTLTAGGDLTAQTTTANHADAYANGYGRSGINLSSATVHTNVNYASKTNIGAGDTLTAGDDLTVNTQSITDANANTEVYGDGVVGKVRGDAITIVGSRQVTPFDYTIDGGNAQPVPGDLLVPSRTEVGAGAVLRAANVTVASNIPDVEAYAHCQAQGNGPSIFGIPLSIIDATANAEVLADTTSDVQIDQGARLLGSNSVLLSATQTNTTPTQYDFAGTGAFGDADTPDPGTTNSYANNVQQFSSTLTTQAGSTIETPSLTVVSGTNAARFFTGRFTKSDNFGFSQQTHFESLTAADNFNASVTVDPVFRSLVVDPSGNVTANGIDYDVTNGAVNIHDMGGGSLGNVTFNQYIVPPPPGDYPYEPGAAYGTGEEIHTQANAPFTGQATFNFVTGGGGVSIVNQSGLALHVNGIDLTGTAAGSPGINFEANPGTLFGVPDAIQLADGLKDNARDLRTLSGTDLHVLFPLFPVPTGNVAPFSYMEPFGFGVELFVNFATASAASPVNIENTGASDLILSGRILDPTGAVTLSSGGNIVEGTRSISGFTFPGGFVEAAAVNLTAASDIFDNVSNVILVQLDEANNQEPTLTASAGGNLYLSLAEVALSGTTNPLTVHLNELSAGGNINLDIYQGAQNVSVVSGGTPVTASVDLHGMQAGGSINVNTPPIDLSVSEVVNDTDLLVTDTLKARQSVSLSTFTGSITEEGTLTNAAINAAATNLNAPGGILTSGKPNGLFDLVVEALSVTSGAGVSLANTGDLTVQNGLSAAGPIILNDQGNVTLASTVSAKGDVTVTASGKLKQTAPGDGVKGNNVTLLANGGIPTPLTVHATMLVARSVNADEYLAADGTVVLRDGDALDAGTGTVYLTGGTFQLDGKTGGNVQLSGATLIGTGTVGGSLGVAGGAVNPGDGVGTLSTSGDLTFDAGATLHVDLISPDGTTAQHDVLRVSGNVNLGGATLAPVLPGGYVPAGKHDSFTIIQATGNVTGTFANSQLTIGGIPFMVVYGPHSVTLVANHAPTLAAVSASGLENRTLGISVSSLLAAYQDADNDPLASLIVTSLPQHGTLTLNGKAATVGQRLDQQAAASLVYTPQKYYSGSDGFTTLASDGLYTVGGQVNLNVAFVNQAPSFTKGANLTVLRNAGTQTVRGWARNISAGAPNESGQVLTFLLSSNNKALFAVQPAIDANGNLTFTPAANAIGTATVTVRLMDNGGTANGGHDTSAVQTFTITVKPVAQRQVLRWVGF